MKTDQLTTILICVVLTTVGVLLPASAQAANNAQVVGSTIPTTMIPGFSYNVSVTMKNTGTTTWTKATGYKLGAVGDSDPFAPTRIDLADADSIAPNQDHTFSFTMIAPSTGIYTTDWRMLRESVEWFGETLTSQVNVSFGPTPPGAPTIIWPTSGMVLGSNRPYISFQGDPSDGYQVHISLYNSPVSGSGWDSGFVALNPGLNPISVTSGALNAQTYYYVFARLHNPNGWGPWTEHGHYFYVSGQLLNDPNLVSGGGLQWKHAMCYNPDRNEYLITWQNGYIINYCRLDATGTRLGNIMVLSDNLDGHHRTVVCYNSARKEYLIEYSGWTPTTNEVRVLRVDPVTANPIGSPIWLYTTGMVFALQMAYSPADNRYLATWEAYSEGIVYGRILDTMGVPIGAAFRISSAQYLYSRNESIAYNPASGEYMITFQGVVDEPHSFDYLGQRLRTSDGTLIGSNFVITAELGSEGPGGVAYDSDMNRYLVVYEGGNPSPCGQFISASGTLLGNRFAIGTGTQTGGMCNVAWNPVTKEYLATWASCCSYDNFGQRVSETGSLIAQPFTTNGAVLGIGNWSPMSVAHPTSGEFLIYWFSSYTDIYTRRYMTYPLPAPDTQPPGPVTNLTLSRNPTSMNLSWTNPSTPDFSATMIRVKFGSPPSGPSDGTLVVDQPNAPGTSDSFVHTNPGNGVLLCYAAFAHDLVAPNYATAATACARLVAGDFDGDNDVDQEDFGLMQSCLSGSSEYGSGCEDADFDQDSYVSDLDIGLFLDCMNGPNHPPGC